jgi:GAF domain-containing protein
MRHNGRIPATKPTSAKGRSGPFRDILEVAHLLSSSTLPEKVVETVITHLCERLGKRARCAFLEGDTLRLRFWAGEHSCPVGGLQVRRDSIVWDAVSRGVPINLTDPHETNGYRHTLGEQIKIKAIIPLSYVDPVTKEQKKLGVLVVDSGKEGVPISSEDFEYLQVIGQLIGAVVGRAELIEQLSTSCRRQEAILTETAHNFRNRIAAIGGFSRQIARLARDTELAEKAIHLHEEVKALEAHLGMFENHMMGSPEVKARSVTSS